MKSKSKKICEVQPYTIPTVSFYFQWILNIHTFYFWGGNSQYYVSGLLIFWVSSTLCGVKELAINIGTVAGQYTSATCSRDKG